jgi:hypothetical protein
MQRRHKDMSTTAPTSPDHRPARLPWHDGRGRCERRAFWRPGAPGADTNAGRQTASKSHIVIERSGGPRRIAGLFVAGLRHAGPSRRRHWTASFTAPVSANRPVFRLQGDGQ